MYKRQHKALAGLDLSLRDSSGSTISISIHKALAGLDCSERCQNIINELFQSTRPSRASTPADYIAQLDELEFQSTRPSRASTVAAGAITPIMADFNPQGPRGPRRMQCLTRRMILTISIHKALAGLDAERVIPAPVQDYFNPQGPRGPRQCDPYSMGAMRDFNPQGPRGPRRL